MTLPITITRPEITPSRAHPDDAGLDLRADIDVSWTIQPGCRELVPTGVKIALPPGQAALVTPRSGLALRHGVTVLNTPGLIDAGYRKEIGVILVNHGRLPVTIDPWERIAQLVIVPILVPAIEVVDELRPSACGRSGGFGSSGRR